MPERDGTEAHPVFDVLVAVDVPRVTAGPVRHHGVETLRELVVALRVRVRPAWHERVEACVDRL